MINETVHQFVNLKLYFFVLNETKQKSIFHGFKIANRIDLNVELKTFKLCGEFGFK